MWILVSLLFGINRTPADTRTIFDWVDHVEPAGPRIPAGVMDRHQISTTRRETIRWSLGLELAMPYYGQQRGVVI